MTDKLSVKLDRDTKKVLRDLTKAINSLAKTADYSAVKDGIKRLKESEDSQEMTGEDLKDFIRHLSIGDLTEEEK